MRRLEHRAAACRATKCSTEHSDESLDAAIDAAVAEDADVIVIDTPGRDDPHRPRRDRCAADTLVTPMNDSFVDLDLIGQVDPENYQGAPSRASMPS